MIRRDNCPAVGTLQKKALRLLFATRDASQVKAYLTRQWARMLSLRCRVSDFVVAKEVKLDKYHGRHPPLRAIVNHRLALVDPRVRALYGERQPYVHIRFQTDQNWNASGATKCSATTSCTRWPSSPPPPPTQSEASEASGAAATA